MPHIVTILLCAATITAIWTLIGLPLARRSLPHNLAAWFAPIVGWAAHAALLLPLHALLGFSRVALLASTTALLVAAWASWRLTRNNSNAPVSIGDRRRAAIFAVAILGAALLAWGPAAALLPKDFGADGVMLASPMFDHAKIALIDEMVRSGVPPTNPFFGEAGAERVPYYYLWHFSAALAARLTGATGWEADVALAWFTAFACLLAMIGLAVSVAGRAAAVWALAFAMTASARPLLDWLIGHGVAFGLVGGGTGFGGWLFQMTWAPQHVASALCVIAACLVLARTGEQRGWIAPAVLALLASAAFQSSVWVGGLTFAVAAALIAAATLVRLGTGASLRFIRDVSAAGIATLALCLPFIRDQIAATASRDAGLPVTINPVDVFGPTIPESIRYAMDVPGYWLVYLPLEFPATFVAATAMLLMLWRGSPRDDDRAPRIALVVLLPVSLTVAWLVASTVGTNNDLGWRAVLPAAMLMVALAAAAMTHWVERRRFVPAALAAIGLAIGLIGGASIVDRNVNVTPNGFAQGFAASPAVWEAVKRHAGPTERVANNTNFLDHFLPWPDNISWALFADRRSCYAGYELALAFAPVSTERRWAIDARFVRVFGGKPQPGDVAALAHQYHCDVVVVTPDDGAWTSDPFAASGDYRHVEDAPGWRIYRKVATR